MHNGSVNMSEGKVEDEALQKEKEDEVFQLAAESNMSGVEADTESDCTPVSADVNDSSSIRSLLEDYMSLILQYNNHGSNWAPYSAFIV